MLLAVEKKTQELLEILRSTNLGDHCADKGNGLEELLDGALVTRGIPGEELGGPRIAPSEAGRHGGRGARFRGLLPTEEHQERSLRDDPGAPSGKIHPPPCHDPFGLDNKGAAERPLTGRSLVHRRNICTFKSSPETATQSSI